MSDIKFTCDAEHAVHFDRDYHHLIGHLQAFKIGSDVTLAVDLNMLEPKLQEPAVVAGLITNIEWGGGPEDAMTLKAVVSIPNRQKILHVVHKAVTDVAVSFQFVVYDYDGAARKWFRTFNTGGVDITGSLEQTQVGTRQDGSPRTKLELSVADTPLKHSDGYELSPQLWEMTAKIKPGNTVQDIHFLTNYQQKIVKKWGVAVT